MIFMDVFTVDAYRWQNKDPKTWDQLDVALWIQCFADSQRLNNLRSEAFADVDGPLMCKMQMEQFQEREPSYGGDLYFAFNQLTSLYRQPQQPYIHTADYQCELSIAAYVYYFYLVMYSWAPAK